MATIRERDRILQEDRILKYPYSRIIDDCSNLRYITEI